jgi:uncharacterized membrane protein YeiH
MNMEGHYAQRLIYPLITLDYLQALIYVVVFSITGVLAVGRKDVDLFGVVMLGLITALGGGTIRDILLNIRVFWVQDFNYVWVGALASIVAFFGVRNFGLQTLYRPLLYLDAVGVALFCVQTIDRVLAMRKGAPVAVLMGMILGIGGGLARDVLAQRPTLLMGREIYATPLLLGGILYVVLLERFRQLPSSLATVVFMIGFRWAAIRWDLAYPRFLRLGSER